MPTDTAMEILRAYQLKRSQNPTADQFTLFKFLLWDRFANEIISDAEMETMARTAKSLSELTLSILQFEKPAMKDERLASSARKAINKFFLMNYPDGL